METILITGAAGFIGSRTSEILLESGHHIIGIDNLNDYYDPLLKKHRLDNLKKFENFSFFPIDIENQVALKTIFQNHKIDKVLNLAARAGVRYSLENPFIYAQTNFVGSLNLLDLMRLHSVKKYVMASTSSIYTDSKMPFSENSSVNRPISPYAATKKAAELMGFTYHHQFGLDVTIVRYFTVYGPAGRPDMSILRFIKSIKEGKPLVLYGDGTQSRDFTYIDDIAKGTIKAVEKKIGYEIINLGGGNNPISMNEIISKIENLLEKKAKIKREAFHSADVLTTYADISKAKKILNWEPEVHISDGLSKTVEWYLRHEKWLSQINFY